MASRTSVPDSTRTAWVPTCCSAFFTGENVEMSDSGRVPTTTSASPSRTGATSAGMSAPTYWLSASVFTMMSAPARRLASMPVMNARARPRFTWWLTTWCTPWARATSTVRSVLPSSMTSSSMTSTPGISVGRSAIVPGSVSSSLKHGIWMISLIGDRCDIGRGGYGFGRTRTQWGLRVARGPIPPARFPP